jgi:hypothetical protein
MAVQVITTPMNLDTGAIINANYASSQQTSLDQLNVSGRGAIVTLNLAATNPGLPQAAVQLVVEGKDSASGQYYPLLVGAPVVTQSIPQTITHTIHPNIPVVPGRSVTSPLPRTWRVRVVPVNGSIASYKVGASIIL